MGKFTITGVFSIAMLNYQRDMLFFGVFYDIIIAHGQLEPRFQDEPVTSVCHVGPTHGASFLHGSKAYKRAS